MFQWTPESICRRGVPDDNWLPAYKEPVAVEVTLLISVFWFGTLTLPSWKQDQC